MSQPPNKLLVIGAFFSIYFIWGSTYLLNKIAVKELSPFFLASVRFTIAGVIIFLLCRVLGISLRITKTQLRNCVISGFLFLAFGNGIIVWALKYVDSGFAALEISAQPLVVLILMFFIQGKKIKSSSIIGVILGVIGIYLLVSQKAILSQENSILGMIMIFACMVSWGYGSLFVGKADLPKNYFVTAAYQMISGGFILCIASLAFNEPWLNIAHWSGEVYWSMALLIIFGSIVAFTSFNYLLKFVSPEKVATSTYVNPIVALFLGWFFLNETITLQSIIAASVLLTGVYFINTKRTMVIFSRFRR